MTAICVTRATAGPSLRASIAPTLPAWGMWPPVPLSSVVYAALENGVYGCVAHTIDTIGYHHLTGVAAAGLAVDRQGDRIVAQAAFEHYTLQRSVARDRHRLVVTDEITNHNFIVTKPDPLTGKMTRYATPLLLALLMVEMVDIIFAVDSVPAIFAVTRDPFIVYTSNIFAILGLRSMYFMLSAAVERFKYLKYGLAAVLVLIGIKIFWNFLLYKELHIVPYLEPHWSLMLTIALLGGAILFSLWKTGGKKSPQQT
jgi:predicted tellurium resistance membrane protein TerC